MLARGILLGLLITSGCGSSRPVSLGDAGADGPACPVGWTACSGVCVDTSKDPENCGSCGSACATQLCGGATYHSEQCDHGFCVAASCGPAKIDCCGACVDTESDEDNCGACGNDCDTNKGFTCWAGTCSCIGGITDCAGTCVILQSDASNCGACGCKCPAGAVCNAGQCALGCPTGLIPCGSYTDPACPQPIPTVCVNTQTDAKNCGACDNVCPSGQTCVSGLCV